MMTYIWLILQVLIWHEIVHIAYKYITKYDQKHFIFCLQNKCYMHIGGK